MRQVVPSYLIPVVILSWPKLGIEEFCVAGIQMLALSLSKCGSMRQKSASSLSSSNAPSVCTPGGPFTSHLLSARIYLPGGKLS